jgi:DNA-binding IclR family transcriptional regulator
MSPTTAPQDRAAATVPAVQGAIGVMKYLFEHPNARAHVIADTLGLNRSTCHGILKTLVSGGLLEFDRQDKTYALGPVLVALGARAWDTSDYIRVARPLLEGWVSKTRFTIFLARLLPDNEFIVVDRVESTHNIKVTVSIGQRFPLVAAALGKAHLAWLPEEQARGMLEAAELLPFTSHSITSLDAYMAELSQTRDRGWSQSDREYYRSATAVAAPVVSPSGEVALVVCSIAADTDMTKESVDSYGVAIKRVADELAARLFASASRRSLRAI